MCNIAAYAGERNAAPILIDMLRREEAFDGYMGTGIVTVHEGRIYVRKVVGNVDVLARDTDALSLPGTVGFIHSRSGGRDISLVHPHVSMDGRMALCTNGTNGETKYIHRQSEAAQMLEKAGWKFQTERSAEGRVKHPLNAAGNYIFPVELRVMLAEYYRKQGKSLPESLAASATHMYADNISMLVSGEDEAVYGCRITRPMAALFGKGETLLATTRFAFPKDIAGETVDLPTMNVFRLSKDGVSITHARVEVEDVAPVTPYAYKKAYEWMEKKFAENEDFALHFDDFELSFKAELGNVWNEEHTLIQHARLIYDILWQFHKEGRLTFKMGKSKAGNDRCFMKLEKR